MTKKLNISFDLETWGTEPGDDIRSIGACLFDPLTGVINGYDPTAPDGCKITNISDMFYIACENEQYKWNAPKYKAFGSSKYPLKRDPRTVQWWSEQTEEAQAAFANPVDLKEALERFDSWLGGLFNYEVILSKTDCINVWSHGSHFDSPILAAAYRACDLEYPLHYRAPRDTRTIFDAAGIDNHSAWLAERPGPLGILHHALDDAICQARGVCDAYARLRVKR